jgi:hypothetical protein
MLLLRLSYVDRTVTLEELLTSLGGSSPPLDPGSAAPDDGDDRASGKPPTAPAREVSGHGPEVSDPELASATEVSTTEAGASEVPEANRGDADAHEASNFGDGSGAGEVSHPEDGAGTGVEPASGGMNATEAWARLMDEGQGIPPGMRPFLRAAVVDLADDGALVVELPDGPGLERLREQTALRTIQNALETLMGDRPEIVVRASGGTSAEKLERITPQTVRSDRLRELIQREPLLQHAVEELDLELLD